MLPSRFETISAVSSYPTKGVVSRVRSMLEARARRGDVNHIVGDVHFLALLLDPARTVITIHDCEFMERAGRLKRWIYLWLWLRLPVWRSRIVVVPTEGVRDDLERYVRCDRRKVRVIPNPVSPLFRATERVFRQQDPVILQVGTRPNKNLERVIVALRGISCRLIVLGPLTQGQRELLAECEVTHEEVVDLPQDEVARRYQECDLVVFASTKEGFGLPIVEAQASGRPVVAGNRAPLPEVAGGGAYLVDPFDTSSIRAGIQRVIEDADFRGSLIRQGLMNVARFHPVSVAQLYAAVYDEILSAVAARSR
jgi:glycosyltransferase involved in cell wall biosynthesis